MHACGHDIHTSVMLGAALLLKEREATLPGRVRILFQPAEENFGGAKTLIRAGALEGVSAIFGMHNEPGLPLGEFATRGGAFYANVDRFVFKVTGKGAHAARPHEGKDAILLASQLVTVLQSVASREVNTLDSVVLSVTRIQGAIPGTCCRKAWSWKVPCVPTAARCSSGSRRGSAILPPVSPVLLAPR
jgi:amidohydrolase